MRDEPTKFTIIFYVYFLNGTDRAKAYTKQLLCPLSPRIFTKIFYTLLKSESL